MKSAMKLSGLNSDFFKGVKNWKISSAFEIKYRPNSVIVSVKFEDNEELHF